MVTQFYNEGLTEDLSPLGYDNGSLGKKLKMPDTTCPLTQHHVHNWHFSNSAVRVPNFTYDLTVWV